MKIHFKSLTYKNFLSSGNQPITISLDSHKSTLIYGANGQGKSLIFSAISFALFGKSSRGINKAQYVNTVNKKDCLVSLSFVVNDRHEYLVERGLKPATFEIKKNGELVHQDSRVIDYQKYFETEILGFDQTLFDQMISLSAVSYVPFMRLRASERRNLIEELLEISVFSDMKELCKKYLTSISSTIKDIDTQIILEKKNVAHAKQIEQLRKEHLSNQIDELKAKKSEKETFLEEQLELLKSYEDELKHLTNNDESSPQENSTDTIDKRLSSLEKNVFLIESNIKEANDKKIFYQDHTSCPTCQQEIDETAKQSLIKKIDQKLAEDIDMMKLLGDARRILKEEKEKAIEFSNQINKTITKIQEYSFVCNSTRKDINEINDSIISINNTPSISDEEELTESPAVIAKRLVELYETKTSKENDYSHYSIIDDLLKDKSGIKSLMIKNYIPVINQILNEYLQKMDLFVDFHFDEDFQEIIKSRHRDTFSYESFSAGQQARIDLSILFTWRKIASMRNSVKTNLLLLDEIGDSSLDNEGMNCLIDILTSDDESSTNIFIISHKDSIQGMDFSRKIHVEKPKNFSEISFIE